MNDNKIFQIVSKDDFKEQRNADSYNEDDSYDQESLSEVNSGSDIEMQDEQV